MFKIESDYIEVEEEFETEEAAYDECEFIKMCGYVSDIDQLRVVYYEP